MLALIRFFVDMALLRRGPQDVPSSSALLIVLAVVNLLIGTVNGVSLFGGVQAALGANLLDLVLTLVMLLAVVQFRGYAARWLQTAIAFLGLGALAGGIILLVRSPAQALGITEVAVLIDLVLAVWLHVALGNILRHALEIPLMAGVIIVLSYTLIAFNLIARVFPPVVIS